MENYPLNLLYKLFTFSLSYLLLYSFNFFQVKGYPEQACPYCRKPMVRCTVCTVMDRTEWAISPFMEMDDEWTVCYSCHHGGHSLHIMDWFQKHDKCAVPKCRCQWVHLKSFAIAKILVKPYNKRNWCMKDIIEIFLRDWRLNNAIEKYTIKRRFSRFH